MGKCQSRLPVSTANCFRVCVRRVINNERITLRCAKPSPLLPPERSFITHSQRVCAHESSIRLHSQKKKNAKRKVIPAPPKLDPHALSGGSTQQEDLLLLPPR